MDETKPAARDRQANRPRLAGKVKTVAVIFALTGAVGSWYCGHGGGWGWGWDAYCCVLFGCFFGPIAGGMLTDAFNPWGRILGAFAGPALMGLLYIASGEAVVMILADVCRATLGAAFSFILVIAAILD